MNVRIGVLTFLMASGALWAQAAAPTTPQKPAASAPATASSTASTKTTTTTKKPAGATKKKSTAKKSDAAASGNVAKNVAAKPKKVAAAPSKRDPFISPVQAHVNGPINCGTGKRCLVLDQTILQGIVKAPNGMIAVVSNSANKAYFLRENDPVYNGYVVRITPDSVIFREQVTDRLGNKSTHEVVKKVNAPAV